MRRDADIFGRDRESPQGRTRSHVRLDRDDQGPGPGARRRCGRS